MTDHQWLEREVATLRAEVARLTQERDEARALVDQRTSERDDYMARNAGLEEERDEARTRLVAIGICGNRTEALPFTGDVEVCSLPSGHAGWHRSDSGTEWIERPPAKDDLAAMRDVVAKARELVANYGDDDSRMYDLGDDGRLLVAAVRALPSSTEGTGE